VKTAFITGVTGQDGAYLAQFLLGKAYRVVGMMRRCASTGAPGERLRWLGVYDRVELVDGDLTDLSSLIRLVSDHRPDEVYNLAAQSFVAASWGQPVLTGQVTGMGAVNLLEAVRIAHPRARFYQASSSEMFGASSQPAQSEATAFHPRSPYAAAKLYAHAMTVNYRESYGLHACAGILFNHESPLRGPEFVTRHITDGVARIKMGLATELKLGNLEARRDWGHARDYVRAMWLMLQQERPEDYVIATGVSASVREFCDLAFAQAGLSAADHVRIDPAKFRPAEVDALRGDASKAAQRLGWRPSVSLADLAAEMVAADLTRHSHGA
jgi:GDPmannose 4,6-dehydratase